MNPTCGCCESGRQLTPAPDNRPGLDAILYRAGTHSTFLESMKTRLSNWALKLPVADRCLGTRSSLPLLGLRTRNGSDFSIALLDAWAMVADVLTFYQERIANEGYLRTATERLSILELCRLIGYELRPGVASSVFLAYTIETDRSKEKPVPTFADIQAGSRAQSIPGPGELPQSFETSAALTASDRWNNLGVRQTKPAKLSPADTVIYFKGIATNLKPSDRLLFDFGDSQVARSILAVDPDNANNRTKVTLDGFQPEPVKGISKNQSLLETTLAMIAPLTIHPGSHPASSVQLPRDLGTAFAPTSDLVPRLAAAFHPELVPQQLYTALENADVTVPQHADVHVFRTRASPFGATAHKKAVFGSNNQIKEAVEWPLTTLIPAGIEEFILRVFAVNVPAAIAVPNTTTIIPAGWWIRTDLTLNKKHLPPDTHPGLKSGDKFTIDLKDIDDNIDVTFTENPDSVPPFQLVYKFQNRPLAFSISRGKSTPTGTVPDIVILSDGTNPTTIDVLDVRNPALVRPVADLPHIPDGFFCTITGTAPTASTTQDTELPNILSLDNLYDKIVKGSWILLEGAMSGSPLISRIKEVKELSRADYGITGKITQVTLEKPWLDLTMKPDLGSVRKVAAFIQSERLELAEMPMDQPLCGNRIELDGSYPGLESGRWLIVSGKRIDGNLNVPAAELVMLAGAEQGTLPDVPDDKMHTFLTLANKGLAYCYDPASVAIYGNVTHATHGESRPEVLGSGDASQPLQEFQLKQAPLTYVTAVTPSGIEASLNVRVNDILWHQAPDLASLGPNDRSYLTRTGDDSKTTVVFGNGIRGARIPTGVENVKAVYRTGIGTSGNVAAEQISLLSTKPLGVKAVINPIRASGGADRESRDSARRNAPLALMSLDRLVSVQDYADFARTFAGVGKAVAAQIGSRVHVTIAGAGGIPIDESSDLFVNLLAAFGNFGDPQQAIELAVYDPLFLAIQARVAIQSDYQFETVAPKIRGTLLAALAFDNRDLGQDVVQSEIIAAIQGVEGVQYVDLDVLDVIPSDLSALPVAPAIAAPPQTKFPKRIPVRPARLHSSGLNVLPAQLAFLTPDINETLVLTELVDAR